MVRGEIRVKREPGQSPVLVQPVSDVDVGEWFGKKFSIVADDPDIAREFLSEEEPSVRSEGQGDRVVSSRDHL